MFSLIIRKSSSLAPKRALPTIQTLLHHPPLPDSRIGVVSGDLISISTLSTSKATPFLIPGVFDSNKAREFHALSGPSCYKASSVVQAEFAVDNYGYDEQKSSNLDGNDDGLEISMLGISQEIVSALAAKGITKLFPIQRAVLEPAMQGRDLFGRARTGTGKTLAFGIPVLDKILKYNAKHGCGRNPLALVMAPTRELARQVEKEFCESATKVDTICVYGGTPIGRQIEQLNYGVDVVVGTPGRIIDLMQRGSLNLSEIQFVILDEADQMLSVGFVDDIERIFQQLPKKRQNMLFSATMPSWIKNLIRNYLENPLTIDLVGDSDQKLADGISIYSIASNMYEKASILGPLITEHAKGGKCIVFTQTKRDADRLANAMARKYRCEALHGDISQSQRERTLLGFRNGNFNILIATDVAARGLDVPNVDLVIHYELPNTSEIFVHRSGRTGRAGKKGISILIHLEDQARQLKVIERDVGCRFTQLPRIAGEGGDADMLGSMGNDKFSSFGGMRDRRFGDTKFGRPGGFGDHGSGRSGGFGNQGFGRSDSRFGNLSGQNRSHRFGNQNQPGNYGRPSFSQTGDLGGSNHYNAFGNNGSGRPSGFGENYSDRSGSLSGDSRSGAFKNFGDSRRV